MEHASATVQDSEGNRAQAEITKLKEENILLKTDKKISDALADIKETLTRIEGKVEIHNNYDRRITRLERGGYIFIGGGFVILFIIDIIKEILFKWTGIY